MEATQVIGTRARARRWRSLRKIGIAYLFLLPAFVILGTFLVYPLFASIWYSFTDYNVVHAARFVGLANYQKLLSDDVFKTAFRNTLVYSVGVIPGCTILGLLLALLVNQPMKGITFFRIAYYMPVITSIVVVGIVWKWMYFEDGIINSMLRGLSLIAKPIPFLSSPSIALYAIMAVTIWKAAGYYMVLYLAGLQSLPRELDEAAMIDGANRLQRLWNVTVPLLRPTIALVVVLASIGAMKVFGEIYVMTSGGPADRTTTLVYYVYKQAFVFLSMGYASSIAVVLFLFLIVLSVLNIKVSERGGTVNY
ncbi:MAG TPA: sugar ABC transporter permease [Chloroflexota bacterium]|nr:sugar ABC transporter permease [Chloroflexota bacterium]